MTYMLFCTSVLNEAMQGSNIPPGTVYIAKRMEFSQVRVREPGIKHRLYGSKFLTRIVQTNTLVVVIVVAAAASAASDAASAASAAASVAAAAAATLQHYYAFLCAVTGLNVWISIISVGCVCIFYTALVS